MTWFEYHELTKHGVESMRRTPDVLDWANMPDLFRHYEGVPARVGNYPGFHFDATKLLRAQF
jgi:hypothetical protein